MEKTKRRAGRTPFILGAAISIAAFLTVAAFPQWLTDSLWPQAITSGRPLSEAAELIQARFLKPITYEDPIWMWEGDSSPGATARGLYPKSRSFSLPDELGPDHERELNLALIAKVLAAYHRETDGPRFRILSSRWGFHIVPEQVRDVAGRWVPATALLETQIDIPVERRTPSMHFNQICDTLTRSSGIRIIPGARWLNQAFEPNGIVPPATRLMTPEEEQLVSFPWGAKTMARDALISLIELSATTLSWSFRCGVEPWDRYCVFNLNPIQIRAKMPDGRMGRRNIYNDRRKKEPIRLPEN